jgi:hypothetical protein
MYLALYQRFLQTRASLTCQHSNEMYSQNGLLMAHVQYMANSGHVILVKRSRLWTCGTGQEQQIVGMWQW